MAGGSYQTISTVSLGEMNPSVVTWNSSTALNTTAAILSADFTANTLIITLAQTTTITGGVVTFQYSTDGANWQNVTGVVPGTTTLVGPTYTLTANTYALFEFNVTGFSYFQIVLSTAITGTGAVTIGFSGDSFVGDTITIAAPISISGNVPVTQVTSPWVVSGTVAATQSGTWNIGTVTTLTSITNAVTVAQGTAANLNATVVGTGTFAVQATQAGTWTVQQGTPPWTIQGDSASGANNAGNPVKIGGAFNTTQPTVTNGQTVDAQMTARGAQIVATGVDNFVVSSITNTVTVTGTVSATQGTSPWVTNVTQWATTALGTPQAFGTVPTGVVIGTSSDIYVAGTRARSNQTTTAAGVVDVNIVGSLGVTNSVTNGTFMAITDNTTKVAVIAATTALKTDQSSQAGTAITTVPVAFGTGTPSGNAPGVNAAQYVGTTPVRSNQTTTATGVVDHNLVGIAGTTVVTAAAGVQKVGIVGSTGTALDGTTAGILDENIKNVGGTVAQLAAAGTLLVGIVGVTGHSLDFTQTVGTAPTNALAIGGQYNTTSPAPTNTQAVVMQIDQSGNKLTFPGLQFKTGAAWTSATAINTLQYATGTTTIGALTGAGSILIQLDQTTTLTGGAVTFQGTYDNINWVTIPTPQVLNPTTTAFTSLTNPYTFVASTNQPFLINLNGYIAVRMNLTTVITGTGSVTPYWATLASAPVQPVQVANLPNTNRFYLAFIIDAVAAGTAEALETMTINRAATTSSASTYTVTAGKTLRLQSITLSATSGSGTQTFKVRIRSATTVTATSPIIWTWTTAGPNGQTVPTFSNWADGIEIAAGQQIAISAISSNASNTITVALNGYEY